MHESFLQLPCTQRRWRLSQHKTWRDAADAIKNRQRVLQQLTEWTRKNKLRLFFMERGYQTGLSGPQAAYLSESGLRNLENQPRQPRLSQAAYLITA